MPTVITFKTNRAFNKEFYSPNGMTGLWLYKQGQKIEVMAKALVGKKTGRLQNSIKALRPHKYFIGPRVEIRANAKVLRSAPPRSYAYDHHQGTKPHVIHAKPGSALSWGPRRGGVTVVAVHHPGTRGNKYLSRPLRDHVRRLKNMP